MLKFASSVRATSSSALFVRNYASKGPTGGHSGKQRTGVVEAPHSSPVSGIIATVFGSTGFTGRYVVSRLGEKGAQVVIPYRGTENVIRHLKVVGDLGQIVPMECDVWKPEQIEVIISHHLNL